jgi:hypothetical protein
MKRIAGALALGIIIGMGIGPALAGAYSSDPTQDTTRALQDIARTLQSQNDTRALQDISRTLNSIDSTLKRRDH